MTVTVYISDLCAALCPADVTIGEENAARTARIKAAVYENLGMAAPGARKPGRIATRRMRKSVRAALIAAAIAALLGATAYAVTSFTVNRCEVEAGEGVTGYWTYVDENGAVTESQKWSYPHAGMVFTFSGSETVYNKPEFRCFYLPNEPTEGITDADGWTSRLAGTPPTGHSFPYCITASNVSTGNSRYIINGKAELVDESDWGTWHVMKITSDYSACESFYFENDRVNYIILFDAVRGYFVNICGTSDMETLEHIACEIEVRESATPYAPDTAMSETIGILEPGRG